jgi:hypothetical protein
VNQLPSVDLYGLTDEEVVMRAISRHVAEIVVGLAACKYIPALSSAVSTSSENGSFNSSEEEVETASQLV